MANEMDEMLRTVRNSGPYMRVKMGVKKAMRKAKEMRKLLDLEYQKVKNEIEEMVDEMVDGVRRCYMELSEKS